MPKRDNNLFCFGIGYVGSYFAKQLSQNNIGFAGSVRSKAKINDLSKKHISSYLFKEIVTNNILLDGYSDFLITIPPQDGDIVLKYFKDYFLSNADKINSITYISSTSIYGNHDGEYVNEESTLNPKSNMGVERLRAEKLWQELLGELPLNILRVAGIYGPNRNRAVEIKQGKKFINIYKKNQVFSRIHIDDLFNIWFKLLKKNIKSEIFNICDDYPASLIEINDFICDALKISRFDKKNFDELELSDNLKSFYLDNKKIDNRKIKQTLGLKLKFPSYKEGYKDLLINI